MQQNNVDYGLAGRQDVLGSTNVCVSVVSAERMALAGLAKKSFN